MSSIYKNENEKDEETKSYFNKKIFFPFQKKRINKSNYNEIFFINENTNLKKLNEEMIIKLESYENENSELKNIIKELNQELNYKDKYLEECQKIIFKLKNGYINEYNKKEKEIKKNEDDIISQNLESKKEIQNYKNENNKLKIELNKLKFDYKEKQIKLKNLLLNFDKNQKNCSDYIEMLKEREKKIEEDEMKIKNLLEENNSKEEQINLLTKYKKEEKENNNDNTNNIISKNNYIVNIFPSEEVFNIDILENKIINNGQINFKLEQALRDILYIPSKSKNFLTKEYLIDMNFKTELLKTECFSNYIREYKLLQFFENNKIDKNIRKDIINKIHYFESYYNRIISENEMNYKENKKLKGKLKEMYLYINKIKKELYTSNINIKLKLNQLINLYEIKRNQKNPKYLNLSSELINSFYIKNSSSIISYTPKDKNCLNLIKKENERLKNEIAILIKEINEQQKEISNMKKIRNNYDILNKNLFSISDYMKYSLIYQINNTKEIINIFNIIINNTKRESDEEKNNFIEIIKNFLIVLEKIKTVKKVNFDEELQKAFNIFVERCNYRINELNEDDIFMIKLLVYLFEIAFFK